MDSEVVGSAEISALVVHSYVRRLRLGRAVFSRSDSPDLVAVTFHLRPPELQADGLGSAFDHVEGAPGVSGRLVNCPWQSRERKKGLFFRAGGVRPQAPIIRERIASTSGN